MSTLQSVLKAHVSIHGDYVGQTSKDAAINAELAKLSARLTEINSTCQNSNGFPRGQGKEAEAERDRYVNAMKALSQEKVQVEARINKLVDDKSRITWRERQERFENDTTTVILRELVALRSDVDSLRAELEELRSTKHKVR